MKALIVVDVQVDFCEGGVLAARDTESLIPRLNDTIARCVGMGMLCVFTRDWHPADHGSFRTQGGPWPVHCVQGTAGADFAKGLFMPESRLVVDIGKGRSRESLGYSVFPESDLGEELKKRGAVELGVCGIATEYCVRATALDAHRLGFVTTVLADLTRPVEVKAGDAQAALGEMAAAGVAVMSAARWLEG